MSNKDLDHNSDNSKKTSPLDLSDLLIDDQELARVLAQKEKEKVISQYELKKLIEQQTINSQWPLPSTTKSSIPVSPFLINLKKLVVAPAVKKKTSLALPTVNLSKITKLANKEIFSIATPAFLVNWRQWPQCFAGNKRRALLGALSRVTIINLAVVFLKTGKKLHIPARYLLNGFYRIDQRANKWLARHWPSPGSALYSRRSWQQVAFFMLVCILIILPISGFHYYQQLNKTKGVVLGISQEAVRNLESGWQILQKGDWPAAQEKFQRAKYNFSSAQKELLNYHQGLLAISKTIPYYGEQLSTGTKLLKIGDTVAGVVAAMADLETAPGQQNPGQLLTNLNSKAAYIQQRYAEIQPLIAEIDPNVLPAEYRSLFSLWQESNNKIAQYISELQDFSLWLNTFLGQEQPKRYLLLFQNSNELRATGGFIGSFGLLDIANGQIKKLDIPGGGSYDLKGQLKEFVYAPYPLQLIEQRWFFWDANWWPDFPTAAQKISWFYEKSGGPTVDGVIAVNSDALIDWLRLLPTIELEQYQKNINADNAIMSLQHYAEFEYDKTTNKPKQIIADLAKVLLENSNQLKPAEMLTFAKLLNQQLAERKLQIYLSDPQQQKQVEKFGWSGAVKNSDQDYLMVVNENIAGGKTEKVVKQKVDYQLAVGPDLYLIARTSITRTHQGNAQDVFERQRNVSFVRIFVPLGAELISVEGATPPDSNLFKKEKIVLEPDRDLMKQDGINYFQSFDKYYAAQQFSKQVYGQWLMVDVGESKTISFTYRLPIKVNKLENNNFYQNLIFPTKYELAYSLLIQKQSGQDDYPISFRFSGAKKWQIKSLEINGQPQQQKDSGLDLNLILKADQIINWQLE